ncbi:MAG: DinB family protein [Dehalococcoidia bacterium]|nr:DinB family protein [Dehalococcoidia bacterium]
MLNPEIEVLLGRAATARFQLWSLVAVLEDGHFDQRAEGDTWSVREHLAHVAAVDRVTVEMVEALAGPRLDLSPFLALRERRRLDALADPGGVQEAAPQAREVVVERLRSLSPELLSIEVVLPARDAWSAPVSMQLRSYLAAWASHDMHHEAAIREAVRTSISPAALALAARSRR